MNVQNPSNGKVAEPKLHHYVPRFHLARFADERGRLWVLDKEKEKVFPVSPEGIAAERHFYKLPEFIGTPTDPLFLEKQFADLEGEACQITAGWLRQLERSKRVKIPKVNRQIMSDFLALQFFRTADQRDLLKSFAKATGVFKTGVTDDDARSMHARILCELADGEGPVADISRKIRQSIWIFAKNTSPTPFTTSDTPVLFKSNDNRIWWKAPWKLRRGAYIVFTMNPTTVLYCHDRTEFKKLERFENCLSPVTFTPSMVEHENTGHVGMSARFVISSRNDFSYAKDFLVELRSKPQPDPFESDSP